MKFVYQRTGSRVGQPGDCFAACLASMLNIRLKDVPNFMTGTEDGKLLPASSKQMLATWLKSVHCGGYVEYGFNHPMEFVLQNIASETPDAYYILTGCTRDFHTHSVVCKGGAVIHDPACEPGRHGLVRTCKDGFFRVGFLLLVT